MTAKTEIPTPAAPSGEVAAAPIHVLWVEDDPEAIAGDVKAIERAGVTVSLVRNLTEAALEVEAREFDFLCVDQRLPKADSFADRGGEEFVSEVKSGLHGDLNVEIPFVVVTADASWIDQETLNGLPGYRGIITKESWVSDRLAHLLAAEFDIQVRANAADRFRSTAIITDVEKQSGETFVWIAISAWDGEGKVPISYSSLPDEVQQEIDSFGVPVDISCTFDTRALDNTELDVQDIERIDQISEGDNLDNLGDS